MTHLGKRVENRTWRPPASVMHNVIAIHAAKRLDEDAVEELRRLHLLPHDVTPEHFARGAVVGVSVLYRVITAARELSPTQQMWWNGPVGWVFGSTCSFDPVPCRGAQGLWNLPDEVERAVMESNWRTPWLGQDVARGRVPGADERLGKRKA
jgi:hypothetical protein